MRVDQTRRDAAQFLRIAHSLPGVDRSAGGIVDAPDPDELSPRLAAMLPGRANCLYRLAVPTPWDCSMHRVIGVAPIRSDRAQRWSVNGPAR
jgi:hypothetical protein